DVKQVAVQGFFSPRHGRQSSWEDELDQGIRSFRQESEMANRRRNIEWPLFCRGDGVCSTAAASRALLRHFVRLLTVARDHRGKHEHADRPIQGSRRAIGKHDIRDLGVE
ncbi:MAG: hypothetical protein KDA99_29410, partial [Planctomycetales bacterium]|nr:hypothetical protein [Planctomycetales bacterium]